MSGQLIRRRVTGPEGRRRILVPLHSQGATLDELIPFCTAVAPRASICAPQAPRCLDPVFSSRPSGTEAKGRPATGFAWFRSEAGGAAAAAIDPVSFGDSLWHVDQLVVELQSEGFSSVVLVGRGEGGLLALAARRSLGAALAGVVALGPADAALPGWAREALGAPAVLAPVLELPDGALDAHQSAVARWLIALDAGRATTDREVEPAPPRVLQSRRT